MTRTSRIAILLAIIGHAAASTGCTLVSGWSDLQDGTGAVAVVDAGVDSSSHDSGSVQTADGDSISSQDSGNPDASSVVPMGVLCGASRCGVGVGCCEGIAGVGASTCETSSQCGVPNAYLTCSDSSQCTVSLGHSAQCCDTSAGSGVPGASCRTTCTAGSNVVCDPTLASPTCPAGKTCQPDGDGFGYDTCQ